MSAAELVPWEAERDAQLRQKAERVLAAWLAAKRASTRSVYRAGLLDFGAFVGADDEVAVVSGLLRADVGEFLEVADLYHAHLRDRELAPNTRKRLLLTLQSVGRKAFRMGLLGYEPRIDDLPKVRAVRDTSGPSLEKVRAVLRHLDETDDRFVERDRVIITMIWELLLRRGEASELDVDRVDLNAGTVSVLRKGWDQRTTMAMTEGLTERIAAWLAVRGEESGPLFFPGRGRILVVGRRLSGSGIRKMLVRRSLEANVGVLQMHPHAWRHTGICTLLPKLQAAGISWHRACDVTGHRNPMSLAPYLDRLDNRQADMSAWLREAVLEDDEPPAACDPPELPVGVAAPDPVSSG